MRSRRIQEIIFLVIGVTTPVGILAVNGSAFVMRNLASFRLILSICALVSALFLNGLAAYEILRRSHLHLPDLMAEYRNWIYALAGLIVVLSATVGAYFTYLGMRDPGKLPDRIAVFTALGLLLVPFAITYVARRVEERRNPPAKPATQARARR